MHIYGVFEFSCEIIYMYICSFEMLIELENKIPAERTKHNESASQISL